MTAPQQVRPTREKNSPRGTRRQLTLGLVSTLAAIALLAGACAADDPLDATVAAMAPDGTPLCVLEDPADVDNVVVDTAADRAAAEDAPAAGAPHDEAAAEDAPAADAPHDEAPAEDAPAEDAPHDEGPGVDDVDYVVKMEMREFGYSCSLPTMEQGVTLALQFTNVGIVEHEAVIGDLQEQHDVELQMIEMAAMVEMGLMDAAHDVGGGGHSVPSITVPAGETQTMIVELDDPGRLMVGCHVPGHWDAGMRADFTVARTGESVSAVSLG
jgi:uncharacterized cupredoxin-like copper-binding protein